MDFMNMFEEMMGELEPSKKEESKKEKKEVKKSKTTAPKKEKSVKVSLPLEVISAYAEPFILDRVGEEDKETELSIVVTHLATQLGFKGLLHEKIMVEYENSKLYIGEEHCILGNDTDVQVEFPVTVAYGPLSAEYSIPEDISTEVDEDEITVAMVAERFKSNFEGFSKAKWSYDPNSKLIIPYWENGDAMKEKDTVGFPATLYFGGENMEMCADDFENAGNLVPVVKDVCEDKLPVSIKNASVFLVKVDKNAYRIVLQLTGGSSAIGGGGYANKKEKKKVEEKYELPLKLIITGFSQELSSEDFDGKRKVTRKDVEAFLTPKYPSLFNDSNRKPSWFYCKELSSLEIVFLSGTKGGA